jgi:ribose-phosphate pyrophosphokinase
MLEEMGVDHVVTVDLHSSQIEGYFKPDVPVDNLHAFPVGSVYFSELQLKDPCVVAPHASAVPKSVLFRDILSRTYDESNGIFMRRNNKISNLVLPMAIVVKKHHIDRSKPGEVVGDVAGKDCIVVDNLVDTGSTLMDVASLLKANGAKSVSAFCVHARYSSTVGNICHDISPIFLCFR